MTKISGRAHAEFFLPLIIRSSGEIPFFTRARRSSALTSILKRKNIFFYTSSIQNPSLMLLKGNWKLFERFTEKLWLKEFRLKPIVYADWQFTSDLKETWGAGLDLKMTYWKKQEHSLGFEGGFSYANEMLRSRSSLFTNSLRLKWVWGESFRTEVIQPHPCFLPYTPPLEKT